MIDDKRFWLTAHVVTGALHLAGIVFYLAHGLASPVAQLWALIVAIHALELPLAFIAVRERGIPAGAVVIKTLIFGFTWWVPVRRGIVAS